jgi:hypothetical protein
MPAIDQHHELDGPRPPVVGQRVESVQVRLVEIDGRDEVEVAP